MSQVAERPDRRNVMQAQWTDPDDIRPDARKTPRQISGWRTYCPLRRMLGSRGSEIEARHIMAADKLREACDIARLGYSTQRQMLFVAMSAQPRAGMSRADMARNAARREVDRVRKLFTVRQREMIDCVILRNQTLNTWCRERLETDEKVNPAVEKGRLFAILDVLAQYFDSDIEDDLDHGRRLPA